MEDKTTPLVERIGDKMSRSNLTGRMHRFFYRVSGGRMGTKLEGKHVLLLTTEGRRSKKRRTVPLMYLPDGDRMLIVGSNAANIDRPPAWWFNLQANPEAEVRLGTSCHRVRASDLDDQERDKWWPQLAEYNPRWEGFQGETSRRFPVVALQLNSEEGSV
jgi:deazaflavin-dependent oxidoreductase (nitroreductase family)